MKAIETTGQINQEGALLLDQPLGVMGVPPKGKKVKVIILMEEEETQSPADEEQEWLSALSSNPAFNFLKDEREDIYSITDGKPLND
jgi:hypothetical protein